MKKFHNGKKMAYKKSTRKTSGGAKVTTTHNTNGNTRRTQTVKPTKSLTISRSVNRNGSVRTTTTNTINGLTTRKSTTSGNPPKIRKMRAPKASTRSRRSRGSDGGGELFVAIFLFIVIAPFYLIKKIWQVAGITVNQEEKNFKWYCKTFGYFILYLWVLALLLYWILS
jgi:hypothetical protein